MKLTVVRGLDNRLKAAYGSDYDKLKKLKVGEEYLCEIRKPRNYKFHKKFYVLLNMVFDNQEQFNNLEDMKDDLIVEAGFFRKSYNIHGEEIKRAKSIAFAAMDEVEFNELYDRVFDVIIDWLKFDKDELIESLHLYF